MELDVLHHAYLDGSIVICRNFVEIVACKALHSTSTCIRYASSAHSESMLCTVQYSILRVKDMLLQSLGLLQGVWYVVTGLINRQNQLPLDALWHHPLDPLLTR